MDELKMVLKDGTEIVLSEFTLPLHTVVVRSTRAEVQAIWDSLTEENLETVTIQSGGETLFTFTDAIVLGEQIVVNEDSTMTGHYYLDGTRQDSGNSEYEDAGRILLGEVE